MVARKLNYIASFTSIKKVFQQKLIYRQVQPNTQSGKSLLFYLFPTTCKQIDDTNRIDSALLLFL